MAHQYRAETPLELPGSRKKTNLDLHFDFGSVGSTTEKLVDTLQTDSRFQTALKSEKKLEESENCFYCSPDRNIQDEATSQQALSVSELLITSAAKKDNEKLERQQMVEAKWEEDLIQIVQLNTACSFRFGTLIKKMRKAFKMHKTLHIKELYYKKLRKNW